MTTIFFRLLAEEDKANGLDEALAALHEGRRSPAVYATDPASFCKVPGSPFAYWVSDRIRDLFQSLSSLEDEGRHAQFGASTKNDFRFLRAWWEVASALAARDREQTAHGCRWVPFAKGGSSSFFYRDWELVVDWADDGATLKKEIAEYRGSRGWGYQWSAALNGYSYYFRPGLTWSRRTSGLNFRILPAGCIFADKGPALFVPGDNETYLFAFSAVVNSQPFRALVQMLLGRVSLAQSFEVGLIQSIPVPSFVQSASAELEYLARDFVDLKRGLVQSDETGHIFELPALLQVAGICIRARADGWQARLAESERRMARAHQHIDEIVLNSYGIDRENCQNLDEPADHAGLLDGIDDEDGLALDESVVEAPATLYSLATGLISYMLGAAFGRWDIRYATGERQPPDLPDPFAPLSVCSPGMLTTEDGLPMRESPPDYPLRIDWDGMLADDPDHLDDVVHRVRDVFELLFSERAESMEREACEILGVSELREYFRRTGNGGFWMDHVKRYSKSRRKAPIYWLLQSSKRNYALWLYYHRLDKDILFKALVNYVEPKLRLEQSRLEQMRKQKEGVGSAGREAKELERQIDRQEALLSELRDFESKLRRAADLRLEPDLNDGVVLNIAPLWELVPWAEPKKYWEELLAGKYEWSSIGKQLRAKGMLAVRRGGLS